MATRNYTWLVLLLAIIAYGNAVGSDDFVSEFIREQKVVEQKIRELIRFVEAENKEAIAIRIEYPLSRPAPLPSINNKEELIDYYETLFDETLKGNLTKLARDEEMEIINRSNVTGYFGILYGLIWFDRAGNVVAINYESEAERAIVNRDEETIARTIHESVRVLESNVYMGATEEHVIKIDETEDGLRYASWLVGSSLKDKPALILYDGVSERQGTAGGWEYRFKNGRWSYVLRRVWMGVVNGDYLVLEKDGEEISESSLREITNQEEFISNN